MQEWRMLDPQRAVDLVDARLQLHHAAQLATALGISYLPKQADDSHTNLEWLPELEALASKPARGTQIIRLAVRPHVFALIALDHENAPIATLLLNGRTIDGVVRWIRSQLEARGLDAERYTLDRHYTIPVHPVADHVPFDATTQAHFEELAAWYANSAALLSRIASEIPQASDVRCWPHHFDIATLVQVSPTQSINLGMVPGDGYYAEPYFYASIYPAPSADATRPPLSGGGAWHTLEWIGAVLPGSRLETSGQQEQVDAFLRSALAACTTMVHAGQ